MRALGILAVAGGLLAVVACSSAVPDSGLKASNLCAEGDDCTPTKKQKQVTGDQSPTLPPTSAPTPAPTTTTPTGTHDAGVPDSSAPATTYCKDLNGCCSSLTSTVERLACIAVAIAGKETPCKVDLAICSGGGIGSIGGGSSQCTDLNKCCDQMEREGYPGDASDCRFHASGKQAAVCGSWLDEYRYLNWCN